MFDKGGSSNKIGQDKKRTDRKIVLGRQHREHEHITKILKDKQTECIECEHNGEQKKRETKKYKYIMKEKQHWEQRRERDCKGQGEVKGTD